MTQLNPAHYMEQMNGVFFHQLREPLRALASVSGLLKSHAEQQHDEDTEKYTALIRSAAYRMHHVLSTVQKFMNIQPESLNCSITDLTALAKDAKNSVAAEILTCGAVVEIHELPTLEVDAKLLQLAFEEAIKNALKLSNRERPMVSIWAKAEDDTWSIHVENNGEALLEEDEINNFDLSQAFAYDEDISGPELVMVNRILEVQGGHCKVSSDITYGTRITLVLPK